MVTSMARSRVWLRLSENNQARLEVRAAEAGCHPNELADSYIAAFLDDAARRAQRTKIKRNEDERSNNDTTRPE